MHRGTALRSLSDSDGLSAVFGACDDRTHASPEDYPLMSLVSDIVTNDFLPHHQISGNLYDDSPKKKRNNKPKNSSSCSVKSQEMIRDTNCLTAPPPPPPPPVSVNACKAIPASLQKRISKTKICIHNLSGRCTRANKCSFAHSMNELREPPDLYKTRLCINFVNGGECSKTFCSYAHGESELRWTPEFYKTSLCPYWHGIGKLGCSAGQKCRWAHGLNEIRQRSAGSDQISPTLSSYSSHSLTKSQNNKLHSSIAKLSTSLELARRLKQLEEDEEEEDKENNPQLHKQWQSQPSSSESLMGLLQSASSTEFDFNNSDFNYSYISNLLHINSEC